MTVVISDLTVTGPAGVMVEPVSAEIEPGATLALIGESGSGKTLTAKSVIGLLPRGFTASGSVTVAGQALPVGAPGDDAAWRRARGRSVSLLLQDPFTSLTPVHRCGDQIAWTVEAAQGHRLPRAARRRAVEERLAEVKLPARVADQFPHELSGGMRQRASLARTLSLDPKVLLLDEPLSALDALTRAELQDQILNIWETDRRTVVMITNDVDEAVLMADRIVPLTMGPAATLAEEFVVNMARPRDRHTLNDHPEYMRLKSEITRFMMHLNKESKALATAKVVPMPDIRPKDFSPPSIGPRFSHKSKQPTSAA